MYGRGQSTLTIAVVSFLLGCMFTTFFNVTPKANTPLTPTQAERRG
jgi:hypothetical protein